PGDEMYRSVAAAPPVPETAPQAPLRVVPVAETAPQAPLHVAPVLLQPIDADLTLRRAPGDLPLQAETPASGPVLPANPSHRILCEVPPPREGWWTKFRRGMSGNPRPV